MTFKIKHIATRFVLQSIFTVFIIAVLIFIMLLSSNRKKDAVTAISLMTENQAKILFSYYGIDKAIDDAVVDEEFVQKNCDLHIDKMKDVFNDVKGAFEQLESYVYLSSFIKENQQVDSIDYLIDQFSLTYTKFLLSLKEKGNSTGGLVQQALPLMDSVEAILALAPDNGEKGKRFNRLCQVYISDLSSFRLMELLDFCEETSSAFYDDEDYDFMKLENHINNLKQTLLSIHAIDQRLFDEKNEKGQIVDLQSYYSRLVASYDRFNSEVIDYTKKYERRWNLLYTIDAIILAIIYLIIMGRFARVVVSSINKLHELTISLANGNIKNTVPEGGKYEFGEFNSDLRSLVNLLSKRRDFINELLNGNYDTKLDVVNESDEIGHSLVQLQDKLIKAKNEQDRHDLENTQRRYTNEGLAKFAEIMRVNSHDISLLADFFIKELVKYLEAMQGALYLTDADQDDELELVSIFAFDRKRYISKSIKLGEGLIGTCAVEKKVINLTNVPENYILIKSGLGDAPPNNVLILPIMNREELVGVIEVTSLRNFKKIEIELTEKIAESLASTILSARNNTKTNELLKKSQVQAAEMLEQEEEMRQNMEELQATQEESARREEEMQGLLTAINKSFYTLEYDLLGNIIFANDRILKFVEQVNKQVLHRTHQEIISVDSKLTPEFIQDIATRDEPVSLSEQNNWGNKKYIYKYFISPVEGANGEVVKIINLFTIDEV